MARVYHTDGLAVFPPSPPVELGPPIPDDYLVDGWNLGILSDEGLGELQRVLGHVRELRQGVGVST